MKTVSRLPQGEFIALMAFMMSLVALSIDTILPALPDIADQFNVAADNSIQQVIGVLFLGLTIGQIFYGPLSDQIGRKACILIGVALYILGSLLSAMAESFTVLLLSRFLQGFGVAAMRVVSMALVRDLYSGAAMARIMSLSMSIFILVPCIAPLLGQSILAFADWRSIFWVLLVLSMCLVLWFWLRQSETLLPEKRVLMRWSTLAAGWKETCTNGVAMRFTIGVGCVQGGFIGYLLSAQQIFDQKYQTGELFALYFAMLALTIGAAGILNAKIVGRFGMTKICTYGAVIAILASSIGLYLALNGYLSFTGFLVVQGIIMFATGLKLGNMNSIAMQPLGHIAGVASSAISFISGAIALTIGSMIGNAFDVTVAPLMVGVLISCVAALALIIYKPQPKPKPQERPLSQGECKTL
jgi:DHA1 family bicyclomycin/chloramphenicol resistance-like MFS transporter